MINKFDRVKLLHKFMLSQISGQNTNSRSDNHFALQISGLQPLLMLPSQPIKGFYPYLQTVYSIKSYKMDEGASFKAISHETCSNMLAKQQAVSSCKGGSVYHNFQKHLVTTLKININLPYDCKALSGVERGAARLWQHFLNAKKPTKKFLYSLLKSAPCKIMKQDRKLKKNEDYFQIQNSGDGLNSEELGQAQAYLREQIVQQCRKLMDSGLLIGRRMRKMQQFEQYFCRFIEDVEKDDFTLRLSKRKIKLLNSQKLAEEELEK